MPTWFPALDARGVEVPSERKVAEALQGLDSSWTVLHSYPWLRRDRPGGHLREGEADFVLFNREHGLLVLEVKGAEVSYDGERGQWWQGRGSAQHPMKDPVLQAQRGMHALLDIVGRRDFPHGFGVVFPDCDLSGAPPGADSRVVFGRSDLARLPQKVSTALHAYGTGALSRPDGDNILRALKPQFRLVPRLSVQLGDDEEQLLRVTDEQIELLAGLLERPRLLVEGVAGSGKTLFAVQRALADASSGRRTLFLCYNKNLAQAVRPRLEGSGVDVVHFHDLCARLTREAGLPWEPRNDRAFWEEETAELLLEALEALPERRWQALVIDEAQDFRDAWWVPAMSLLEDEERPLRDLYDPAQNLYGSGLDLPPLSAPVSLRTNCRNTQAVFGLCHGIASAGRPSRFAPAGLPVSIELDESDEAARERLRSLLREWKGDLAPRDVAGLSPRGWEHSVAHGLESELTGSLAEWQANQRPLFSTIKAFKGLEARAVVVVDLVKRDSRSMSPPELHVGFSRARTLLHLHVRDADTWRWLRELT